MYCDGAAACIKQLSQFLIPYDLVRSQWAQFRWPLTFNGVGNCDVQKSENKPVLLQGRVNWSFHLCGSLNGYDNFNYYFAVQSSKIIEQNNGHRLGTWVQSTVVVFFCLFNCTSIPRKCPSQTHCSKIDLSCSPPHNPHYPIFLTPKLIHVDNYYSNYLVRAPPMAHKLFQTSYCRNTCLNGTIPQSYSSQFFI